jgi:hypothetical protein
MCVLRHARSPASSPPPPRPSGWNSAIAPDFPKLYEDFKQKQFPLLWRGGRDGFGARDFHSRCDGHPNTLTAILDTDGNIFGGFTPVEWESRYWQNTTNCFKAGPSLKSFLFTLKNPHNEAARRFVLKAEKKDEVIYCHTERGPHLWDIGVCDGCNERLFSDTFRFGMRYTNDTGLHGERFFTGSERRQNLKPHNNNPFTSPVPTSATSRKSARGKTVH